MVYKRYIKRGDKVFGPYYYESYRDSEGNIVSKYLKDYKPKKKTPFFLIFLCSVILILGVFSFISYGENSFDKEKLGFEKIFDSISKSYSSLTGFMVEDSEGVSSEREISTGSKSLTDESFSNSEEGNVEEEITSDEVSDENPNLDLEEQISEEDSEEVFQGVEGESTQEKVEGDITEDNQEMKESGFEDEILNDSGEIEILENISINDSEFIPEKPLEETENNFDFSSGGSSFQENLNQTEVNQTLEEFQLNETELNESLNQTELDENLNESELNETLLEEEIFGLNNESIETLNSNIVLGKPVRWVKKINLEEINSTKVKVEIPINSEKIEIKTGTKAEKIEDKLEDYNQEMFREKGETSRSFLTGYSISESGEGFFEGIKNFFSKIFVFTGFSVGEEFEILERENSLELVLDNTKELVVIEYETPAPYSLEEETSKGKIVKIVGPENIHYENVLVFAEISKELEFREGTEFKIYWVEEEKYIESYEFYDLNGNGLYDYVEWIAPHLSNQTFEITITVLNPLEYLKDGDLWKVYFNTTGVGNLTIYSPNAFFEEIPKDNLETEDEMEFLNLKCGEENLIDDLYIITENEEILKYSEINESVKPLKFFVENYSCLDTGEFSSFMNIAGYAVLNFSFADESRVVSDLAVDPSYNLTNGLVSYWKLDESSGSTAYDSHASDNRTAIFTYSWISGKENNALRIRGRNTNDQGLALGALQSRTSAFTHSFWVRSNNSNPGAFWGQYANNAANLNFFVGTKLDGANYVFYVTDRPSGTWVQYSSSVNFSADTWYHVVITMNSSSHVKLYVNAVSAYNRTTSGATTVNANLGLLGGGAVINIDYDEWAIWNRELSLSEIQTLYNSGNVLPYENFVGIPTVNSVILNSSSGTNTTNENLTAYINSTNSNSTITDWRVNGASWAAMNMPFDLENSSVTKDYSTLSNNGSVSGATWVSNCKVGGCYSFDGSNDKITLPDSARQTGPHSIVMWINSSNWSQNTYPGFYGGQHLTNNNYDGGIAISSWGSLNTIYYDLHSSTTRYSCAWNPASLPSTNQWHHLVVTYDGNEMKIYFNGSRVANNTIGNITLDWSGTYTSHQIGAADQANNGEKYFKGRIDEFMIFNRALSAEQISAIYQAGLNNQSIETIVSQETSVGENWSVRSTPTDLSLEGTSVLSSNLTILDLVRNPIINSVILNSSSGTNTTNENLTAYISSTDTNATITDWRLNGTSWAVLNMPFDLNDSTTAKDYSTYGNNGTLASSTAKPTWSSNCKVGGCYNFDGGDYITVPYNGTLNLTNNFAFSLWIKPSDLSQTNRYLLSKRNDAGTDNVYSLIWEYVNNQVEFYSGVYTGDNPRTGSGITLSDTNWHHIVYSYNGSKWEGYLDGSNVFSLSKSFSVGKSTNNLLFATFNAAGNYFNGSIDEVMIFDEALSAEQISAIYQAGLNNKSIETIVSQETSVGENWSVMVTPTNFSSEGTSVLSSNLTILGEQVNSAPTFPIVILNSSSGTNTTFENLSVYISNSTDLDEDLIYNITDWRLNGTSWAVLNLPFDLNDSTTAKDYSTYGNNGSCFTYGSENIALSKTASQSSTYLSVAASNAVDGNTSTFQHTNNGANEWWSVDLGANYSIGKIQMIKRSGFGSRPANYKIQYSYDGSNYYDLLTKSSETSESITFDSNNFSPFIARYLRVYDTASEYLNIAEFRVYQSIGCLYGQGKVGNSIQFDGTNYLSVAGSTYNFTTPFSVSFWVKRNSAVGSYDTVFSKSKAGSKQYSIDINSNKFRFGDEAGVEIYSNEISNGNWYHIVAIYNGTNDFSGLKMYINGTEASVHSTAGTFNGTEAGVGNLFLAQKGNGAEYFNGSIDEFLFFKEILSSEQINAIYQAGVNNKSLETIVSQETSVGENWSVMVAPTDLSLEGTSVLSSNLTIIKGTPTLTASGTTPISYGTAGDVSGSGCPGGLTCKLYRNGTEVSSPDTTVLGAGVYSYLYNTTGDSNYNSAQSDEFLLTVNKDPGSCSVLFNETSPLTYPATFNVWSNCTTSFVIYREGNAITNNSQQTLSAGSWNFSVIRTDSQNYSNIYDEQFFEIEKAIPIGSLNSSEGWVITYPTETTISLSESNPGDGDVTYKIYRNGTDKETGETVTLEPGVYEYVLNTTGGTNYTENSSMEVKTLVVEGSLSAGLDYIYAYKYQTPYFYRSNNSGASFENLSICSSIGKVVSSGEGKYVYFLCESDGVYKSSDYGANNSFSKVLNYTGLTLSSSSNGKYLIVGGSPGTNYYAYYSNDYGETWNQITSVGSYSGSVWISQNGRYMTIADGNWNDVRFFYSKDYGQTWQSNTSLSGGYDTSSVECSEDGKYWIIQSNRRGIFYSNDSLASIKRYSTTTTAAYYSSMISEDGRVGFGTSNTATYKSTDYLGSWSTAFASRAVPGAYGISENGSISGFYNYISFDYGSTFNSTNFASLVVSRDGSKILGVNSTLGQIFYSNDSGSSFTNVLNVTGLNGGWIPRGLTSMKINSVILSSSSGKNTTDENLSVYVDSYESLLDITDWRLNGTSWAVLNMPFDLNDSTTAKDYSTYGNNGTLASSTAKPTWSSNCKVGGCYNFDGGDYIDLKNQLDKFSFIQNSLNFTISAWVKIDNLDGRLVIVGDTGTSNEKGFMFLWETFGDSYGNHSLRFVGFKGTGGGIPVIDAHSDDLSTITDGGWHNVVVTSNSTFNGIIFYVDGVQKTTTYKHNLTSYSSGNSSRTALIGSYNDGSNPNLPFNGSIDELLIFNRALSAEQINVIYQAGVNNKSIETIVSQETSVGENWSVMVTPTNFSSEGASVLSSNLTILEGNKIPNTPTVLINSTDGSNKTNSNLNCYSTISDPDGDAMNVSVKWYKNGVENLSINYTNQANGSLFVSTLNSGNTTKNDNWSCSMRVYDGSLYSGWGNSSNLTILNSLPTVSLSSPDNNDETTDRTPLFEWSGSDADGDTLTYDINITARPTGSDDDRYQSEISNQYYTPTSDLKYLKDNNYYYIWKVRAHDGDGYGEWSSERNISINALIQINLTVDYINFGFRNMSSYPIFEGNTSEEGEPNPLTIQNEGNSLVNISLNASPLWQTVQTQSEYYQFKISNHTGHEGAFSWLKSLVQWTQVPLTGNTIAIGELNYSENKRRADIDVYIRVPENEPPGVRNSTIIFGASLAE